MRPAVFLSNNYFIALAFLYGWRLDEAFTCDTKWIRLVYMLSCGKKKRESVWAQNDTFYENLPPDFDGAFKYFKERDPFNPLFSDSLFYEVLREDDEKIRADHEIPKLLIYNIEKDVLGRESASTTYKPIKATSVFLKKLLARTEKGNHLGIQGFPPQWDIEEIVDEKINENHRRQINRLIDECCKVPPVSSCNGSTFSRFCKRTFLHEAGEEMDLRCNSNFSFN